jgi:adenosine kinase
LIVQVIVSGSLAYDRIMDFSGHFSDHIIPEKIHVLNICFQVNGMKEKFGGTAGNIAYALSLMGVKPEISASIGHDHHRYLNWLESNGISTQSIRVIDDDFTACAYITTDRADNQITGFNPGAMRCSSALDWGRLDPQETLVIISPGNLEDMIRYPQNCKGLGISYIFDPGQSLPMLASDDLTQAIDGSRMLICNDYELDLITQKTGLALEGLLQKTATIIVTLGESGSRIYDGQKATEIPAVAPDRVDDPTGAGDSYRGGLISGLVRGLDVEQSARLGSVCASFAIECYGTQEYRFSSEEFEARYRKCYGWPPSPSS